MSNLAGNSAFSSVAGHGQGENASASRAKRRKSAAKKAAARKAAQAVKKPSPKKPRRRHAARRARTALRKSLLRRHARPAPKPRRRPFDTDLDRNRRQLPAADAAHRLERAASVFPDHTAIIHGRQRFTYAEFYARCRKLASALAARGIRKGDTVAVMLANTPAMLEAHHGVPMTGAVLNALNTRLDAAAIAYMLEHGGAKILITDREFAATVKAALALLKNPPLVIDYDDPEFPQDGERLGEDYEAFLASGDPDFAWAMPGDEWDAHRAELHLRHHRQSQGRGLSSSRRGADGLCQHAGRQYGPPSGAAVDAAHVPLQWLVLSLEPVGAGRHPCLPALGAGGRDLSRRWPSMASPICAARRW